MLGCSKGIFHKTAYSIGEEVKQRFLLHHFGKNINLAVKICVLMGIRLLRRAIIENNFKATKCFSIE